MHDLLHSAAFPHIHTISAPFDRFLSSVELCPQDPTMTCTGTYTIDQADMNSGRKNNTGEVTSLSPMDNLVGDTNDDVVLLAGTASITFGEEMLGVTLCQQIVVRDFRPGRRGTVCVVLTRSLVQHLAFLRTCVRCSRFRIPDHCIALGSRSYSRNK